jgi:hypothetical protein
LRRKQAQYATLAKQIEALQAASDKLREVAPLLADGDEEGTAVVLDDAGEESRTMSAKATSAPASAQPASKAPGRGTAPRWP